MTSEEHQELEDDLAEDLDLSGESETGDVRGGDSSQTQLPGRMKWGDLTLKRGRTDVK